MMLAEYMCCQTKGKITNLRTYDQIAPDTLYHSDLLVVVSCMLVDASDVPDNDDEC